MTGFEKVESRARLFAYFCFSGLSSSTSSSKVKFCRMLALSSISLKTWVTCDSSYPTFPFLKTLKAAALQKKCGGRSFLATKNLNLNSRS